MAMKRVSARALPEVVSHAKTFSLSAKSGTTEQGFDTTLKSFDDSLKRLHLDYLDLYLVHWPVVAKYRETWRALELLYTEKRVRAIGVSNFLRHHLGRPFTGRGSGAHGKSNGIPSLSGATGVAEFLQRKEHPVRGMVAIYARKNLWAGTSEATGSQIWQVDCAGHFTMEPAKGSGYHSQVCPKESNCGQCGYFRF